MQTRHNEDPAGCPPPASVTPKFDLGQVVATPGALNALAQHQISPLTLISRHVRADFGDIDQADWQTNLAALRYGQRIVSAYTIAPDEVIWIISEGDRSVTTLLLPSEY
jgi:hypothetical protein